MLLTLLLVLFVGLKLAGIIAWSWWLVISPVYVAVAFYVLIAIVAVRMQKKHIARRKAWWTF